MLLLLSGPLQQSGDAPQMACTWRALPSPLTKRSAASTLLWGTSLRSKRHFVTQPVHHFGKRSFETLCAQIGSCICYPPASWGPVIEAKLHHQQHRGGRPSGPMFPPNGNKKTSDYRGPLPWVQAVYVYPENAYVYLEPNVGPRHDH